MLNKLLLTLFLCCIYTIPCNARVTVYSGNPITPLTFECLNQSAKKFDIPVAALIGLLAQEGGTAGQARLNDNGSWDLGVFQINTLWLNVLPSELSPYDIMNDSCVNALIASWILKYELNRSGSLWEAIGNYHSKSIKLKNNYRSSVFKKLLQINNVEAFIQKTNARSKYEK